MKRLSLVVITALLISCNQGPEEDAKLIIPDGCDTTGIYLALDSCLLTHPGRTEMCLTQEYLNEWCHEH